jgi:hypothetical protein
MLFFLLDNISPRNDHPETSINIRHEYFTSTFDSKGGASQRVEGFLSKFNKNKKFSSPAFALRVSLLLLPACLRIRKMPEKLFIPQSAVGKNCHRLFSISLARQASKSRTPRCAEIDVDLLRNVKHRAGNRIKQTTLNIFISWQTTWRVAKRL